MSANKAYYSVIFLRSAVLFLMILLIFFANVSKNQSKGQKLFFVFGRDFCIFVYILKFNLLLSTFMPTVLRIKGFRFFFYSNENDEPPHIHVENAENTAKIWLLPVEMANSYGFSGKEICTLARYAGISDKLSALGLFNFNDTEAQSITIAQLIWYFIEGVNFRWNDYPFGSKENYTKFIVTADEGDIVFWKSNQSDRWWIEVAFLTNTNNKYKKITLLPCAVEDYNSACNNILPERWWKAQLKNT